MRWRLLLGLLFGLAAAFAIAVGVALRSLDLASYRERLAVEVRAATGRELRIGGGLVLRMLPAPGVTAEDLTFANASWGSRPEMATLRRFEVEVALLPLLRGRLHVRRLVLEGADLLLETGAGGERNWAFHPPADEPDGAGPGGPALPALDEIRIEDSTFRWRDGRSGEERTLRLASAVAHHGGSEHPLRVEASAELDGRPLRASGAIGPTLARGGATSLPLDLEIRHGSSDLHATGEIQPGRPPR
ncbi:MAG: AsmA family protein, partial [Candidatus Binatia bacterium]